MDATGTLTGSGDEASAEAIPIQYLVLAFDCAHPLTPSIRMVLDTDEVLIGRDALRRWSRPSRTTLAIGLSDDWISSRHARLFRDDSGGWILEDRGSKNGTFIRGERVQRAALENGTVIQLGRTLAVFRALNEGGPSSDQLVPIATDRVIPETMNPLWWSQIRTLLRVAASDTPILLSGPTGTGKEVLARAVHVASGRRGPFTPINCGAIPRTLVESELFGVKKGAFSGATEDRAGLLNAADGGTLFLDEIAELPESSQVALLRVLQEREVLPVGATQTVPVDIRIVSATQDDLSTRVDEGRFRSDLYARLCGHSVHLPLLRDRVEDIGILVGELLRRIAKERANRISFRRTAAHALFTYGWPRNVRELEQALRAAIAIAPGDEISLAHLPAPVRRTTLEAVDSRSEVSSCRSSSLASSGSSLSSRSLSASGSLSPARALHPTSALPSTSPCSDSPSVDEERERQEHARQERARIMAALEASAWNQTRAARALGISRATLVNRLTFYGVPRPRKS